MKVGILCENSSKYFGGVIYEKRRKFLCLPPFCIQSCQCTTYVSSGMYKSAEKYKEITSFTLNFPVLAKMKGSMVRVVSLHSKAFFLSFLDLCLDSDPSWRHKSRNTALIHHQPRKNLQLFQNKCKLLILKIIQPKHANMMDESILQPKTWI